MVPQDPTKLSPYLPGGEGFHDRAMFSVKNEENWIVSDLTFE